MREIWIPELLCTLLALVFLARPLFKGLWPLDGIAWFPLLALGIALVIFPAYGFRPECVPLAFCLLLIFLTNLRPLFTGSRHNAEFRERGPLSIVPAMVFLVLTGGTALFFAPDLPAPLQSRSFSLEVPDRSASSYTLHVFEGGEAPESPRPLIFLVPPEFGGLAAVERICAALGERGFSVISYSRDRAGPPGRLLKLWRAFLNGTRLKKANDAGRSLEAEKRAEVEFVLSYTRENLGVLAPGADGKALFLAGWGTGGAALAYLTAEEQGPAAPGRARGSGRGPGSVSGALGLVVVESRFWSSWTAAPPPEPAALPPSGFFPRLLARAGDWFGRFRPEKTGGPEAVPRPGIPALYLLSDRALDEGDRGYAAVFAALRSSGVPAALAVMEGAGPLDYSDLPAKYPLYRALFPGRSGGPGNYAENCAALIARFCELAAAGPPGTAAPAFNGRLRLPGGLYLETRSWNFEDLRLY